MNKKSSNLFLLIAAICLSQFSVFSQRQEMSTDNSKFIGSQKRYNSVEYYPEVWGESEMDMDIVRMKKLKMNVVRIAEFSWSKMEPTEGKFDFRWLHRIVDKIHANGIDVILCTPTATPAVWLGEKHSQIYQVDEISIRKPHGARRNTSYSIKILS